MAVLHRQVILRAARTLVELRGVPAVTMRAVADELGVTATALYYHFPNKAALVGALVDQLVNETMATASGGATWQAEARKLATAVKDLGSAHSEWMSILVDTYRRSPAVLALHETGTAIFLRAGFAPDLAMHGYRAIMRFVVGHVSVLAGGEGARNHRPADEEPDRSSLTHGPVPFDADQNFNFGLDLLIEGLERRLERSRTADDQTS